MAHYALASKIIALSVSDTWEGAKREWTLVDVFKETTPATGELLPSGRCWARQRRHNMTGPTGKQFNDDNTLSLEDGGLEWV